VPEREGEEGEDTILSPYSREKRGKKNGDVEPRAEWEVVARPKPAWGGKGKERNSH